MGMTIHTVVEVIYTVPYSFWQKRLEPITATQILLTSPFCYLKFTFTNGSTAQQPCLSAIPCSSQFMENVTRWNDRSTRGVPPSVKKRSDQRSVN